MSTEDDIPFNRNFPLAPGVVDEVVPGVRRILCNNPSPFTFTGTVSYIVGRGNVAIIDPGPDDEAHAKALLDAVRGETVTHILVTHTHRDHSPNAARLAAATGAKVYAEGPHRASRPAYASETRTTESGGDWDFRPDVILKDGEIIRGDGWTLEAISTPGHTANHMALEKLTHRDEQLYFSGHGPEIPDAVRFVKFLIRHRKAREVSILHRLAKGEADIPTIVRASYIGIDPRLMGAAGYSVLAHLEDLVARGVVATDGDPVIGGTYRLGAPLT